MKKTIYTFLLAFVMLPMMAQNDFHATWISTVCNIDWPSRQAIGDAKAQQAEMIAMLDSLQKVGLNAVIFQVRPTADALYRSRLEPWSKWLSGTQGQPTAKRYDPLKFVVREAHKRGMQVHVWLNPYRVTNSFPIEEIAKNHIYNRHPEWFWKYGSQWYFEPGLDETRQWLCAVVADLVKRYDIQAIHMDDYFYPYKVKDQVFPDSACFAAHPRGYTDINDWRRNNVNMAIREIHETIQRIRPEVEFGISPFGVWRNKKSDPRGSDTWDLQNYDDLYADILLWMKEGWIDYVCPQLYWYIGQPGSDYEILAHWWAEAARETGCKLYIGMAAGRQRHLWADKPDMLARQLRLNREIPEIRGEVFFSTKALLSNPSNICDTLKVLYK